MEVLSHYCVTIVIVSYTNFLKHNRSYVVPLSLDTHTESFPQTLKF